MQGEWIYKLKLNCTEVAELLLCSVPTAARSARCHPNRSRAVTATGICIRSVTNAWEWLWKESTSQVCICSLNREALVRLDIVQNGTYNAYRSYGWNVVCELINSCLTTRMLRVTWLTGCKKQQLMISPLDRHSNDTCIVKRFLQKLSWWNTLNSVSAHYTGREKYTPTRIMAQAGMHNYWA